MFGYNSSITRLQSLTQFFQTSAPRAELREGGAIQPDMDKLQDLEASLDEFIAINNEAGVRRRRVTVVMLTGELDLLRAVPDGVGDPEVGIAVGVLVAPAEAERVQRHQLPPPEQQVLDERGERLRLEHVVGCGAVAAARLAGVEAARGGPQVASPPGEHARAHRLPRLEVRQDPGEDPVGEAAEAVAASRRPLRCCALRGHSVERVTCTDTAAGMNT
ncbi:hypothetical protein C2845_PM13G04770 [Panicum miliaceum]|uniref:Uncharacterized protein n=1 Tax=Panicum miliaceum TaxID=4540 RepID=A0A3L6RJ16_PANMI|nr:hypothetical protein C2845_PM13G04770 [Panicum miliaceum]